MLFSFSYYKEVKLFRALKDFIVQFGLAKGQKKRGLWKSTGTIKDDPNLKIPFMEGTCFFYSFNTQKSFSMTFFISDIKIF